MSLGRGESRRNVPTLTPGKWAILIAGFVVFAIVCAVLFVRSADADFRRAENQAIRLAKAQGGLTGIDEATTHTWNETVWVVSGKDAEGTEWMVFERSGEIVREKASELLSKQQMLDKFAAIHEGSPIRMLPGWFEGKPAWEIRYWNEKSRKHQSLDFYSMKDGAMLKTYVLSSQK